ncbi:ENTH domain containing protein [Rhodotorula toruloides]|uniref:ENTH domain containing protein n=1 Tax=Rhodotorula toruloides TaxID=5286 RepID=A0A511KC25_RHOTO|nr:ENTH domain containing protein [Rhodotorula toruloides]
MSMRKTVELATKPKRAAPKAKYIDPIVQATFSQDGQLQDIVRTLATRLRDPNPTVVFKSLITLHTIMRSGSLDPVFSYLSSSSIPLSLSGQEAANVAAYGHYLASRVKAYGNLKRDVIRDKSDRRAANRLRKLTVEQGLLRETREIQRMIAALVDSKFYTEDVDDDVSMTALRLLVKDLLVLFTCVNEGVINVLENFFGMSHVDATTALKIYKTFCRDTEKVVAYLGTAKKLYNVLNIPIPNIKHAPLSLASSLEEYLNDPNFEQNRQEYKENKRIADGGTPRSSTPKGTTNGSASSAPATSSTSVPSTSESAASTAPKSFTDFFESIETSQVSMFNSPQMSGGQFQQQPMFAPFAAPPATGMPFTIQPTGLMPQMTGNPFLQPQMTGFAPMQPPQMTGFLQPQATGMMANPFRQSMMITGAAPNPFVQQAHAMVLQATGTPFASAPPPVPQMQPQITGMTTPFGQLQPQATGNPFGSLGQRPMSMMPQATGNPFQQQHQQQPLPPMSSMPPPVSSAAVASGAPNLAPTTSSVPPSSPSPLVPQKTGARNPFAPAPGTIIPQSQPKPEPGPSMNELASNAFAARLASQYQQQQIQPQQTGSQLSQAIGTAIGSLTPSQHQQQEAPKLDAFSAFVKQEREKEAAAAVGTPLIAQKTGGRFASIASDLARTGSPATSQNTVSPFSSGPATLSSTPFSSSFPPSSLSTPFSSLASPGSASSPFSPSTNSTSARLLVSQPTGFAGSSVKPFQPSSSFGSKLASELGSPSTLSQPNGFGSSFGPSAANGAATPSSPASPAPALQPQSTGFSAFGGTKLPPLNTPLSVGLTTQPTGTGAFSGPGPSGVATGSLI